MLRYLNQRLSAEDIQFPQVIDSVYISLTAVTDTAPQARRQVDGQSTLVPERPTQEIAQESELL